MFYATPHLPWMPKPASHTGMARTVITGWQSRRCCGVMNSGAPTWTHSLAIGDALFTKTQQRVLGLLFGKSNQSFYTNEIVRNADMGRGIVSLEFSSLVDGCQPQAG